MSNQTVLISGAGIAGPTLAYRLARHGFHPTVVERAGALRSSGSPVDVRGRAVDVAEQMGVMARIRDAATDVTATSFVNATGRRVGRVNMRALQQAAGSREVELPRGDLAAILYQASRDHAEFVFRDAIVALSQDQHGVDVTFDHAQPRRFDLVIGADGLHSAVRRLAFGPEADFAHHMGLYVATMRLDGLDGLIDGGREVVMYNTPGRAVAIHPSRGDALAFFAFRSPAVPDFDYRDTAQHKRLLATAFQDGAWRVPELLQRMHAADDLYFDSVSQVRLRPWWHGRVALLGDAASCVSLFGDGSSLAMAGAFTLAEELGASPGDHQSAFRRYEASHRTLVDPKQRNIARGASLLIPATRRGILVRNLATRLWPLGAAAGWVRRRLAP
jgi:2-polyprenyl-6-methoxyphenol hydroxylase-like FAD-dependent oxidoreductase